MDSTAVGDRTATWQARFVYLNELGINEPDDLVEAVRPSYERWIKAREALAARDWEWELYEAEGAASEAMDRAIKVSGKSLAAIRRNTAAWIAARDDFAELTREHDAAKQLVEITAREYLDLLNRFDSRQQDGE